MKQVVFFCALLLLVFKIYSQDKKASPVIDLIPHYGFIFDHRNSLGFLIEGRIPSYQLNIGFQTSGNKQWHHIHNFPVIGFGSYYANLGNPEVLGKVVALYGFINAPWYRGEKFSVNYQVGFGMSYLSHIFDADENYLNTSIGSHLNVFADFSTDVKYHLAPNIECFTGLNFTHYSNGNVSKPNLGINVVSTKLGIRWRLRKFTPPEKDIQENFIRKNERVINYSLSSKDIEPPGGKKFLVSSCSFGIKRSLNPKHKIGLGSSLFFDSSQKQRLKNNGETNIKAIQMFGLGVHISYDFVYGKISVPVNWGHYLYSSTDGFGYMYHRLGFYYAVNKHWSAGLSIKSRLARADFIEWGINYSW